MTWHGPKPSRRIYPNPFQNPPHTRPTPDSKTIPDPNPDPILHNTFTSHLLPHTAKIRDKNPEISSKLKVAFALKSIVDGCRMVKGYMFTVHVDGCFMYDPLRYDNGFTVDIHIDRILLDEMVTFLEEETKTMISSLYWVIPDNDFEKGLVRIGNDNELQQLFEIADDYGHIHIYVDHFGCDMRRYIVNSDEGKDDDGKDDQGMDDQGKDDEGDDEYMETDEDDDDSDVNSLDHLSEGEEELAEVRKEKASAKNNKGKKELPKLGVGRKTEDDENEDLMAEHDEFMADLLQNLKSEEQEYEREHESDEERENFPIHDPRTHWKLKKPMVGERYESAKQFKECVTYYALANGYSIWFERSSSKKMIAKCGQRPERVKDTKKGKTTKNLRYPPQQKDGQQNQCKWRCYARLMKKEASFQEFGKRIRMNPDIKLIEIADLVIKKYKCMLTPSQCRRAKMWALNVYEKSLVEHYGLLRAYGDELLRSNPGSTVKLGVTTNPNDQVYFDRFYVCLHGLKEGWKKGCRRIIALDGCFLKTVCQGELLSAIGRDGYNHIFPVAWAVVNVENKDNWEWFIRLLGEDLDIPHGVGLTLISDQHKTANPGAYDYLMKRDPKTWSRAFFEFHSVCEAVENGFSECFNAIILKVRTKPIITMLEAIRAILMERMERMRRISASRSHDICPVVIKRIEAAMRSQRYWQVLPGGPMVFEVRQQSDAFIVDEFKKTCSCRMWQLSGIPCLHAVTAICYINKNPQDYVPDWFRRVKYAKTYASHICAVQGINQWPPNELNKPLPPKPRTMPGRPEKKRKRAIHEPAPHVGRVSKVGTVITCKICGGEGHNRNGCKKKGTDKGKATGKGKATAKGKGIDKGKGIAMDDGDKREWSQTVGGFMRDARKGLRPLQETMASQQEVHGKKVRKQRVKGLMR
ncbi:hypothetical protein OSB04_031576 [Centaurea solstitialis]|uniref:SWIM-type domain-containing protein n=1 Tax=Centaurea solstitialis TaxID=347529 RepID=A0AA38SAN2_9ASTR|nr:hypothetical protein OSB04_031576 [Centaurea solstitialis]